MDRTRVLCATLSVAGFLVLWEVAAARGWIDAGFFGRPSAIWASGLSIARTPNFGEHVRWSLSEFLLGMLLAAVVGIPLGLVVGYNRVASELLDPLLMAFNSTPRVALVPLIVVWFGVGIWAKALVAFAGAFFPIVVTLAAGLKGVDPSWIKAAKSFGSSEGQIFRHVLLPSSAPYLMAGLKLGIGRAVIGVIIAEMFAATRGIGLLMGFASSAVRTNELLFLTLLVSIFGVAAVKVTEYLEARVAPWKQRFEI